MNTIACSYTAMQSAASALRPQVSPAPARKNPPVVASGRDGLGVVRQDLYTDILNPPPER